MKVKRKHAWSRDWSRRSAPRYGDDSSSWLTLDHLVARHSSERYSSQKVFIALATLAEYLGLDAGLSKMLTKLFFSLPQDRRTELEGVPAFVPPLHYEQVTSLTIADLIGLKIAARACFDPEAAAQSVKLCSSPSDPLMAIHFC
jgi:hypothetical protein